jgi:diguanylate cyclase (GGDEF)-like protein
MRIRLPYKKIGLATKFNALAISLVLVTSIGISFFMVRLEIRSSYQDLLNHGETIADTTSRNCEFGVYTEDQASLLPVIDRLAANSDIIYASVLTRQGTVLVFRVFHETAQVPDTPFDDVRGTTGMRYREVVSERTGQRYFEIVYPIVGNTGGVTDALLQGGDARTKPKVIGYLRLGLAQEGLRRRIRDLLVSTTLFTTVLVFLGIGLTVYLSRRITLPLARLKDATQELSRGNFDTAVPAHSNDEIADLARGFEHMRLRLRDYRDQLLHDALHDALTALPNRALFIDRLNHVLAITKRRPGRLFAVLFLDIDDFKVVNDSLGHAAGDLLLIEISKKLKDCVRPGDTVARLGGDEFGVLLEDIGGQGNAIYIASRILNEFVRPVDIAGHEVFTSSSIGIALSSAGYESHEQILRDADLAMYQAKARGRGSYALYEATMHAHAVKRLQLETDLRRAVERREFVPFYQPIVASEGGRVVGFEALARWRHPEQGLLAPAEFLPLAEETGIVVAIDRLILEQACEQMLRWMWAYPKGPLRFMSVNLSNRSMAQRDLVEHVASVLRKTALEPGCLKLEITESVIMENPDATIALLAKLRVLGVKLFIDDFGTGYSSLSHLLRMPIHGLKIDRSFIQRLGEGGETSAIVKTILSLSSDLKIDAIAEGVETDLQLERIRALNCQFWQGHLFSRPVESGQARAFIESGPAS